MNALAGLKILDLTHRLPGPLAGKLLRDHGADVLKLEDATLKDAFLEGFFAAFDDGFVDWYHQLNGDKRVERLDFNAPDAAARVRAHVEWADVLLLGMSPKLAHRLGLSQEELAKLPGPKVVLHLGASRTSKSAMHDLNALAELGLLPLHVAGEHDSPLAPPFLPAAGIAFGQQVALTALAQHRQAERERKCLVSTVYLLEEAERVFGPFWSQRLRAQNRTKFLHNGAYPCYALYRTKDGDWLAVAAVEEKFWREFTALLSLPLAEEQRFSRDQDVFRQVAQAVSGRTTDELDHLLAHKDICVSLVRTRAGSKT